MKLRNIILTVCMLVMLIGCLCTLTVSACPPPPPPPASDTGAEIAVEIHTPPAGGDPNSTEGEPDKDPILLSSGEFLFKRTDSTTLDTGLAYPFPIVRTYRSKPAPVTKHVGRDQMGALPNGSGTTLYSDACVFRWKEPPGDNPNDPYDQYYLFNVTFNISPSTGYIEEPLYSFCVMPADGEWPWTGRAFRFQLGTGTTYHVSVVYTRRDPSWWWSENDDLWCAIAPYATHEIYRWETEFTIPTFPVPETPEQETGNNIPTDQDSPIARGAHNHFYSPEWTPGWDMSYNMHLDIYPDPNPDDDIDERQIRFYSGDGNIHVYKPYSASSPNWQCPTRDDYLTKTSSGFYYIYMKNRQMYMFNLDGSLYGIFKNHQIVNRFHYSTGYGPYSDLKRLDAISDVYGRRTELIYTDSTSVYPGNLAQIRDWAGRTWTYDYYPDGNLKSATDPEGFKETYYYTTTGLLEKIEDDSGTVWLENHYTPERRVDVQTLAGVTSTLSYNGSVVTSTDAVGVEEVIVLNDDGYALSKTIETETSEVTTEFEYNAKNKVKKITYPQGNGYELGYGNFDNLTSVSMFSSDANEPDLTYTATYYNPNSVNFCQLNSVTDPRGNATHFSYNSSSLLNKITYPQVMTDQGLRTPEINFTYNTYDLVETITAPDGIVVKYEYYYNDLADPNSDPNLQGLIKTAIIDFGTDPNCLNITYGFTYGIADANSYPTTDPNLLLTGMRTVTVENPDGQLTTLTYDALNLLRLVENASGHLTRLDYNADRKLEKVQRQYGSGWQEFEYGYNIMAKLQTITDSLGRTTTLDYDDRLQVEGITDPNNNTTQKSYNTRMLVKEIIDAEDSLTAFDYTDNGQLRLITDAENSETEYVYDGYGRLKRVVYANDSYEEYGYDAASNITSFRNRADETISFGYDAMNRLEWKQRPNDPNIVLTYDIAGRLVDVSQSTEQMSFAYDRLGRMERTVDQNGYEVGYEHDAMGRREKLEYPDGSFITYEYDNIGRLQYVKDQNDDIIVEYVYDSLSRTINVRYYRGQSFVGSMAYAYEDKVPASGDQLGNRIAQIDYCCNPSHTLNYTYDSVGNAVEMNPGGGFGWTYGYDNVYQVRTADQGSATNRAVDLSYDRVYNRTNWSDTLYGSSLTYDNNAVNQYTSVGTRTPSYDSRGNLTCIGQYWTMTYDCENRMTSAISGYLQYGYDLLGRRNRRMLGSMNDIAYVWDGAHIIAEYTNGSLTKKYIYGPGMDNPVAMINVSGVSETWYYYYADALGSIRLMSDAGGAIVESYAYDPSGKPHVMTSAGPDGNWLTEDVATTNYSSIGNPYLFTARRWDSAAELYYYRFRDYSPDLGRFLQADPLGYIDGMNLYQYCGNNPVNWIDPWGLDKQGGENGPEYTMPNGEKIPMPPGVDIDKNMREATQMTPWEFKNAVKPGGKWDFKRDGNPQYDRFGNFHYGAVGKAAGFSEIMLLNEGGRVNTAADGAGISGTWWKGYSDGVIPYGDQWQDHWDINQGFDYYDNHRPPTPWPGNPNYPVGY